MVLKVRETLVSICGVRDAPCLKVATLVHGIFLIMFCGVGWRKCQGANRESIISKQSLLLVNYQICLFHTPRLSTKNGTRFM